METSGNIDLRLKGKSLHKRLLDGDLTASAEIAEMFLPLIVSILHRQNPDLYDPHLAEMAADDALISYLQRPSQYNPAHLPLDKYLIMSARGDLLNLLRKQQYPGFPKNTQFVELNDPVREHKIDIEDDSLSIEDQAAILASPVWPLLERLLPNVTDLEIALLMLEGVRDTDYFASVLEIYNLPQENREAEVKRHKDRIKKILKRHTDHSELDEAG